MDAMTRRNLANSVEVPGDLTAEERRAFTFSPMKRVQPELGKQATPRLRRVRKADTPEKKLRSILETAESLREIK